MDRNIKHTQIDANRLGLTLDQQITLSGESTVINPLSKAAYYIGHTFHDNAIPELYKLSKTASHIFPMAKAVGEFFSCISEKFYKIASNIHYKLTHSSA